MTFLKMSLFRFYKKDMKIAAKKIMVIVMVSFFNIFFLNIFFYIFSKKTKKVNYFFQIILLQYIMSFNNIQIYFCYWSW